MPPSSAYLFLEVAMVVFFIGFCWEHWRPEELVSWAFWGPALCLATAWVVVDQLAVRIGLWSFPEFGSLRIRFLSLPLEEYVLFFLHTLICSLLLRLYEESRG